MHRKSGCQSGLVELLRIAHAEYDKCCMLTAYLNDHMILLSLELSHFPTVNIKQIIRESVESSSKGVILAYWRWGDVNHAMIDESISNSVFGMLLEQNQFEAISVSLLDVVEVSRFKARSFRAENLIR